jgi:hypothetical protein
MSAFLHNLKNLFIGLGLIAFIGFIFWAGSNFESKKIIVAGNNLRAWIADDPAEQAKGLSGKESMPDDRGMLFILPVKKITSFWMKGMKFPLDFIWLDNSQIIDITPNVPPCKSEENCPTISPSAPINYVLEVNSGWVSANNVSIGQSVTGLPE